MKELLIVEAGGAYSKQTENFFTSHLLVQKSYI
jgi:hypothetical protein